jgi:TP901 family phage tail tape measure protein
MAERLELGDLIYRLGFESEADFLRALERVLDKADDEAGAQGRKAGESFRSQFVSTFAGTALGSALGTALTLAFSQAMAATRQFVTESNQEFRSYQLSLNQIAVAGVKDLEAIKQQIKAVSDEARLFSETDIASSVAELIKAGFEASEALELVRGSVNIAASDIDTATGKFADLTGTSITLGNVLRSLGLPLSEIGRLTDVVALGAQTSNLSTTELTQILSELGGIAKTAGISLEQLTAAAAELSNKGEQAETIATGLRSAISALIDPPATVKKQFDALGISLVDSNGKTRDFMEVIGNLERVTAAGGRGLQFLASGMDTIALQIVSKLGSSRREIQGLDADLRNAGGAAEELRKGVTAGLEPMINFEREIQNAKRALGEGLQPVLVTFYTEIAPKLVSALQKIVDLYKAWQGLADAVARATGGKIPSPFSNDPKSFSSGALIGPLKDFNDPARASILLTRISDEEKKLAEQRKQLENLQRTARLGVVSPLLAEQLRAAQETVKTTEAEITRLKADLEKLRAKPPSKPTEAPTSVSDSKPVPANIPTINREGKTEDAIVKRARELEGQLRVLQQRYKLGQVDAAQYRAELERLQRQLQALEKQATTTERKQAVLGGLGTIKDALEALEKTGVQPRLEALNAELERQNRLFAETKNVNQYAGALASLEQKAQALRERTTNADARKQIDKLLSDIADGRRKLETTLAQLGEEAAISLNEAAAERLKAVYGDGFQAALAAIRRSFTDFNTAIDGLLAQGFDEETARELAARAFPENFLELTFANLSKTVDPETTGFAEMGAKLGEAAGRGFSASFADIVKNQRRLELDRVFSFDELKALSDQELVELRDQLREIGLEGSAAFEQINAELAFRDPALAAKIEEETALAEGYYQVQEGARGAARGIDEYRESLRALSLGNILSEIDRLQSALAQGFDRPEEAEAARQQLDAATAALIENLNAQREGVERGIVSEEAFAASLQQVIVFLKSKTNNLEENSAAALNLRNQIAALEEELQKLTLIETPLTSSEFADGLRGFNERVGDALDALALLRQEFEVGLTSQQEYALGLEETIRYFELLAAEEGLSAEEARRLAIRIAQLRKELEGLIKINALAGVSLEVGETLEAQLERINAQIAEYEAQITRLEQEKLEPDISTERLDEVSRKLAEIQAQVAALRQVRSEIELEIKTKDIQENLEKAVLSAGKTLVDGIQEGNIQGAFEKIFEDVAGYFESLLLNAILGPIAQQLAASVASAMAPLLAANPLIGLGLLAGIVGLGALFSRPKPADERAAERVSSRSGVSTLNVNVTSQFDFTIASALSDPATRTAIERLVGQIVDRQLEVAMRRAGLTT